jgi:hypothetical protein
MTQSGAREFSRIREVASTGVAGMIMTAPAGALVDACRREILVSREFGRLDTSTGVDAPRARPRFFAA